MVGRLAPWALGLAALGGLISALAQAEPASPELSSAVLVSQLPAKGALTNPYATSAEAATRGRAIYLKVGCQSCHGTDASRGPSLINSRWVYGSDDDTLFRLIALGSEELRRQGYQSSGRENVHRPMPAQGEALTADEIWAMIAWLRTVQE